jgi:hypothetical protein
MAGEIVADGAAPAPVAGPSQDGNRATFEQATRQPQSQLQTLRRFSVRIRKASD